MLENVKVLKSFMIYIGLALGLALALALEPWPSTGPNARAMAKPEPQGYPRARPRPQAPSLPLSYINHDVIPSSKGIPTPPRCHPRP